MSFTKTLGEYLMNIYKKYKNIIFDLGGVLIKFYPKATLLEMFGSQENIPQHFFDIHKTQEWREFDRGTYLMPGLIAALPDHFDKQHAREFVQRVFDSLELMPEGLEIFKAVKVKGYKVFILSNLTNESHAKFADVPNFFDQFDGAIFSYLVKKVKPEPEIYTILLETYGLNPEECLFIDDLDINIQAGKDCGIDGLVCQSHQQLLSDLKALQVLD